MKAISTRKKTAVKTEAKENSFLVVAIGASAGGLEAMMELLKYLPADTGMAFIYVQHLSPEHKSMLTEILSKKTSMKVQEIDDMDKITPNNIFVIPYNKGIEVTDGHIKLIPRSDNSAAISIDVLFSSLAEAQRERVIGIVLSGSASDGTVGMKVIKQVGGLTFAQDDSAKYTSMPHSAIAAGVVDFVLSAKEIALELERLSKHPMIKNIGVRNGEEDLIDNNNPDLKTILNYLLKATGVDFCAYKMNTIKRRIIRRMLLYKITLLNEYAKLLAKKKEEIDILYQDLLINVTSFFRDTDTHHYLKENLLPKILKRKQSGESIRIWVPACATGEEAYSIAIMLIEIQESKTINIPVQIFATDLSEQAISKARIGFYTKQELESVSPKRLQRFFTVTNGGFHVNKAVREMCVFAQHNILQDPPFSQLDFISCCNLFIYLDNAAQKKAINTFHYALNELGFLMLGKSENITQSANLFASTNKKYKIFTRKFNSGIRTLPNILPRYVHHEMSDKNLLANEISKPKQLISFNHNGLDNAIDNLLVSEFMPACVIINHQMEILQFRGITDLFLTHPKGRATFNILKMARPEIAFELRNSISKVIKTKRRFKKSGIEFKINALVKIVSLEIVPLKIDPVTAGWNEPLLLVIFTEQEQIEVYAHQSKTEKNSSIAIGAAKDRRIKKLELELEAAHADALSLAQEQEAFSEELQSAHEEVVSSNEELQTLNEELETSKEEIESANEELTTTNQELQMRNDLLNESYDFSEAIIATVQNPMVVLDKSLRLKSASKAFYEFFEVKEVETIGLLLYDLGNKQWNIPRLRELLEDILPKNSFFSDFEITHSFPKIGEKKMLLNASRIVQKTNHEELILLAFADVTELRAKALELQLKEYEILELKMSAEQLIRKKVEDSEKRYNMMLMQSPFAFAVLKGKDMKVAFANDAMKKIWDKGNTIKGKSLMKILPELKDQEFPTLLHQVYTTGIPHMANESLTKFNRNGVMEDRYFNFVYQPYREIDETIIGVTLIAIEVTPEAEFNKKMKVSEENFRQLAELLPQKISQADERGNVFFYNSNWLKYAGLGLNELKGEGWKKIIHPDDQKEFNKHWQHCIKTGNHFAMEIRFLNKQKEYKWHLSEAVAIKDEKGNIFKWVIAANEINQQVEYRIDLEGAVRKRTTELVNANDELLKINKELEAFTYVSSHDLQEPLRKIQTFSSLILEKENQHLSDNGKNYFRLMQQEAQRMKTLIQDLLAFSKLNTTDIKFEFTDLNVIIDDVKNEFKELIAEKHAVIEVKEICEVHVIPFQFRQLMRNLISNALKFSNPTRPPHIKIESRNIKYHELNIENLPFQKEYCHITISDNGIGFEKEFSEKIFKVFQRLYGKEEYSGTGIGLAIVKKIVENHHGIITATGEIDKGATFNIYIPTSPQNK